MLILLLACAAPTHLQYDYGRAYYTSFQVQADLSRSSVTSEVYPLNGVEAEGIRAKSVEATTTTTTESLDALEPTE